MDKIFWTFVLFFALVIGAIVWTVDFFFKKRIERIMRGFFSAEKIEGDIIKNYEAFCKRRPVLAWLLQWPLLLFGM